MAPCPTKGEIKTIETTLGYVLPTAYISLMQTQNGGIPKRTICPTSTPTSWADDHIEISGFFPISSTHMYGLIGEMGTAFWGSEWGYPSIGIAIADCPSGGHDLIYLDYRQCGAVGEPSVVHIDVECEQKTELASSFEEFVQKLKPGEM